MVRMSDILKKARLGKEKKERPEEPREEKQKPTLEPIQPPQPSIQVPTQPATQAPPPQVEPVIAEEAKPKEESREERAGVSISSVVMKNTKLLSKEESLRLYEEALSLGNELIERKLDVKSISVKRVTELVEKIVDQLTLGNKELLILSHTVWRAQEHYLMFHLVSVCVYSIEIGIALRYDKSKLLDLGISGFLHDIGMIKYLALANQPRKLTTGEYNDIKNHPGLGAQILENIAEVDRMLVQTVYQEHERLNGKGYPRGLKDAEISKFAKIIGIVDVYAAMTHPRPYRNNNRILPLQAIQEILNDKNSFESEIVKILIERIGLFPPGSCVELNTKEIAQVIRVKEGYPLRPVVKVMYDATNKPVEEERIIDLTTQYNIYVVKAAPSRV